MSISSRANEVGFLSQPDQKWKGESLCSVMAAIIKHTNGQAFMSISQRRSRVFDSHLHHHLVIVERQRTTPAFFLTDLSVG